MERRERDPDRELLLGWGSSEPANPEEEKEKPPGPWLETGRLLESMELQWVFSEWKFFCMETDTVLPGAHLWEPLTCRAVAFLFFLSGILETHSFFLIGGFEVYSSFLY